MEEAKVPKVADDQVAVWDGESWSVEPKPEPMIGVDSIKRWVEEKLIELDKWFSESTLTIEWEGSEYKADAESKKVILELLTLLSQGVIEEPVELRDKDGKEVIVGLEDIKRLSKHMYEKYHAIEIQYFNYKQVIESFLLAESPIEASSLVLDIV